MRVLLVSSQDVNSGSGRAAFRLMEALRHQGIETKMVVRSRFIANENVLGPVTRYEKALGTILPFLDIVLFRLFNKGYRGVHSSALLGANHVHKAIRQFQPDLIHLHWVNGGTLNLSFLSNNKLPVVCSLHDEWLYTGCCHVANGCEKYITQCNTCPELGSISKYDLSYFLHLRKKMIFKRANPNKIIIVGLSQWIVGRAQRSIMLNPFPIVHLPNCIDVLLFKPINRELAREVLNLPKNKKIVLFGALNATSDNNKGFDLLREALNHFKLDNNVLFIVLGAPGAIKDFGVNNEIRVLSHRHDNESLVLLYNASDVVVVPSRQENLSNTIMESMACGTPVAAFRTGGNEDMIEHLISGYLAKSFDSLDLYRGIQYVINAGENLRSAARNSIVVNYSYKSIASKYVHLYKRMLYNGDN